MNKLTAVLWVAVGIFLLAAILVGCDDPRPSPCAGHPAGVVMRSYGGMHPYGGYVETCATPPDSW